MWCGSFLPPAPPPCAACAWLRTDAASRSYGAGVVMARVQYYAVHGQCAATSELWCGTGPRRVRNGRAPDARTPPHASEPGRFLLPADRHASRASVRPPLPAPHQSLRRSLRRSLRNSCSPSPSPSPSPSFRRYTLGVHHVSRQEDFPVRAVKWSQFELRPVMQSGRRGRAGGATWGRIGGHGRQGARGGWIDARGDPGAVRFGDGLEDARTDRPHA